MTMSLIYFPLFIKFFITTYVLCTGDESSPAIAKSSSPFAKDKNFMNCSTSLPDKLTAAIITMKY